jgi:ubiquinone/menaquinone biosynthesis C-methylase UbiE
MKNIVMAKNDQDEVIERYSKRFQEFGHSPKTLGWDKGKQDLRYHVLFEEFDLEGKSILDIGCGFGDANKLIKQRAKNYKYLGIDIVEDLINEAEKTYKNSNNIEFILDDFLKTKLENNYDIVVSSGVFNFKLDGGG